MVALGAYSVLIFGGLVTDRDVQRLTNVAWTIASLVAALASWQTSRQMTDRRRTAWRLFAAASTAWLIGQLIWDWNALLAGVNPPFPNLADIGYISFAGLFAAGLLFFRTAQPARRVAPQRLANLGLILCSLAVVFNRMIVEPLLRTQASPYFVSAALIGVLSIATCFVVAIYSLWSYRWREDLRPMLLIVLSLTVHTLCGFIYAHHLLLSYYGARDLINMGWILAFGFQHWAATEQADAQARGVRAGATYQGEGWIETLAPALLLLFIASMSALTIDQLSPRAMWVNAALLGVFGLILAFREVWLYSRGLQLHGRLERMHAALENARERMHRISDERAELERNVELTARAGGVGLWDWDLKSDKVHYSREWKRQLGYVENELCGDSHQWHRRLHPDDAEMAIGVLNRFLADPAGEFSIEARIRHRDGSYRWILSRATILRDHAGAPARMVGSHVDITQLKHVEMALRDSETRYRNLADELEQRVMKRTAELSDAYRDSQSFAYAVAHDLQAPLRAIVGFSHLLRQSGGERLTDKERGYVERMHRGAMHMASLIDGLLAYSRVEHYEVRLAGVDLRKFIDELLVEMSHRTEARQVQIDATIAALRVRADREGLRVVLRNVIENAIKFTRGVAQPRIEIGVRHNGSSALLWVKDNGIGFEQAYHDKLFEIFQRLHRHEEVEGTGIGLALARKAMQRMGGRIWAQSSPGKGATFFVELPLFDAANDHDPAQP